MIAILTGGQSSLGVVLLASLDPWLAPLVGVAVLGAALARSRALVVLAAVTTVTAMLLAPPWPHGGRRAEPDSATRPPHGLTVMAQNLQFGRADAEAVVAQVRAHDVDVLVLTELTPDAVAALDEAGLDSALPHSYAVPRYDASGTGLWSRLPLTQTRQVPGTTYVAVEAVVKPVGTSGEPVTLLGLHSYPPTTLETWQADYAALSAHVEGTVRGGGTVVLAGDLNAGVHNAPLRRLMDAGGLVDAGTVSSWSWMDRTWPSDRAFPPAIRIDHVLVTPSVAVASIDSVDVPGTDHRGVLARLVVSGG